MDELSELPLSRRLVQAGGAHAATHFDFGSTHAGRAEAPSEGAVVGGSSDSSDSEGAASDDGEGSDTPSSEGRPEGSLAEAALAGAEGAEAEGLEVSEAGDEAGDALDLSGVAVSMACVAAWADLVRRRAHASGWVLFRFSLKGLTLVARGFGGFDELFGKALNVAQFVVETDPFVPCILLCPRWPGALSEGSVEIGALKVQASDGASSRTKLVVVFHSSAVANARLRAVAASTKVCRAFLCR